MCCVREPENIHDKYAPAVKKSKNELQLDISQKNYVPPYISSFLTNDVTRLCAKLQENILIEVLVWAWKYHVCIYKFAWQESSIESLRTAIYRCSEKFNLYICKQCDYTENDLNKRPHSIKLNVQCCLSQTKEV